MRDIAAVDGIILGGFDKPLPGHCRAISGILVSASHIEDNCSNLKT